MDLIGNAGIGTITIISLIDIDGIVIIRVLVGDKGSTVTIGNHDTRAIIDTDQATNPDTIMTPPPVGTKTTIRLTGTMTKRVF